MVEQQADDQSRAAAVDVNGPEHVLGEGQDVGDQLQEHDERGLEEVPDHVQGGGLRAGPRPGAGRARWISEPQSSPKRSNQ
ncbi:hypothetical protein [Streptomyces sp. NPDC021212]|uniref:hypothetical protein n=1 Tax=Streptomyces sp. NPDC021212 TaxID=3365118 RepID=UPI0037BA92AB